MLRRDSRPLGRVLGDDVFERSPASLNAVAAHQVRQVGTQQSERVDDRSLDLVGALLVRDPMSDDLDLYLQPGVADVSDRRELQLIAVLTRQLSHLPCVLVDAIPDPLPGIEDRTVSWVSKRVKRTSQLLGYTG